MRVVGIAVFSILTCSVLSACSLSVFGGVGVCFLAFVLSALLFGASTKSCVENAMADPGSDALSDGANDAGVDAHIGPCLAPLLENDAGGDAYVGPCLSTGGCNIVGFKMPEVESAKGNLVDKKVTRNQIISKVMEQLPPDVVARLKNEQVKDQ